jgi:DNA-binding winged helix-turn-helix (wHTH) protein/TolB-like protein/Tfp pilus assembly protein PilF
MSKQTKYFYEFGAFRLDVSEKCLRRGDELVPLTPKVFETLLMLVEHNGHVLGKVELMESLWPDSFVEEGSLAQNISLLRKALSENGSGCKYIETVPKRGYRFVADVSEVRWDEAAQTPHDHRDVRHMSGAAEAQPEAVPAAPAGSNHHVPRVGGQTVARRHRYLFGAGALLLVAAAVMVYLHGRAGGGAMLGVPLKSIAVLPFKSLDAHGEDDQSGLGMADALVLKLSGLRQPRVLPTSTVFQYTWRKLDALTIGRELGVDAVLDGTIQRTGDGVRVTAQLISLRDDGRVLWAGKFDQPSRDIFTVQDAISEQVAAALTPQLTAGERDHLAKQYTQNVEAYQAYMTGVYFWNKRTKEGVTKAIEYFRLAIGLDPNYALAYAGLSDCYNLSIYNYYDIVPATEASEQRDAAAQKAMALDDSLAEAHLAMATSKLVRSDYEGANSEYRIAVELNPNSAITRVRYAYFLLYSLRLDTALAQMRQAQQLDPISPITNGALGYMLTQARQYDEAVKYCRRALELDPNVISGHFNLGEAYVQQRQYDAAIAEFRLMSEEQSPERLQALAYTYAAAGRRREAEVALATLRQLSAQGPADARTRIPPYNIALVYAALDDIDAAFAWLEQEKVSSMTATLLKYDPQLDPLRTDSRFTDYLRRHHLEAVLEAVPR